MVLKSEEDCHSPMVTQHIHGQSSKSLNIIIAHSLPVIIAYIACPLNPRVHLNHSQNPGDFSAAFLLGPVFASARKFWQTDRTPSDTA